MGWWQTTNDAHLGDEPLDALNGALDEVVSMYNEAIGRSPTVEEWQALLGLSLMGVLAAPGHKRPTKNIEVTITVGPPKG